MSRPAFGSRTDVLNHPFIFASGNLGLQEIVSVGLVDDDCVCQLHDALLDTLQVITGTGEDDEHEEIDHRTDGGLGLTNTYCLNQNDIVASRLAHEHRLTALSGDTAEGAAGRRRSDEGFLTP